MSIRILFYFSFVLVFLGTVCLGSGLVLRHYRQRKEIGIGHTVARVVRLDLRKGEGAADGIYQNRYHPVLQYYANGQLYETVFEKGAYPSKWETGQKVPIDYDAKDPGRYKLSTPGRWDALPSWLYYGGVALLLTGILLFIRYARRGN